MDQINAKKTPYAIYPLISLMFTFKPIIFIYYDIRILTRSTFNIPTIKKSKQGFSF